MTWVLGRIKTTPWASLVPDSKGSACSVGDPGLSLAQEDPLEKGMATHSGILAREFQGQRSLAGRSPRARQQLDATE